METLDDVFRDVSYVLTQLKLAAVTYAKQGQYGKLKTLHGQLMATQTDRFWSVAETCRRESEAQQ